MEGVDQSEIDMVLRDIGVNISNILKMLLKNVALLISI